MFRSEFVTVAQLSSLKPNIAESCQHLSAMKILDTAISYDAFFMYLNR
jgi:hypothetical protein